jgi:hypothetical protein
MAYAACSDEQVTTVGLESALVGEDLNGCAFVYGSLSFLDKMSCGIALFVLESYEGNHDVSMGAFSLSLCVSLLESSATGWGYIKPCRFYFLVCRHNELRRDEGAEHGEQVRDGSDPLVLRRPGPGSHLDAEAAR